MMNSTRISYTWRLSQIAGMILLALSPFAPWFPNYGDGSTVSLWAMLGADATDAIGNLTYDGFTFRQTLQLGYATSAFTLGLYVLCTWGDTILNLRAIITNHLPRTTLLITPLSGCILFIGWVGWRGQGNLAWGYWLACAILAVTAIQLVARGRWEHRQLRAISLP